MAVNSRQNNLFAAEDWDVAYQAYTQVDLQAYDFDTIRSAMVEYIKTNFPENFNDYIESSEFIAIIELLAYLGQSIAFRMDINTRENFLETAERRDSVFKLARMLGYNPKRNIPASGLMKVLSISTTEPLSDSLGNQLNNRTITWNDANNPDSYEQFITIMNSAFGQVNRFSKPVKTGTLGGIVTDLYEINTPTNAPLVFNFESTINGQKRQFEFVNSDFADNKFFYEKHPDPVNNFGMIYRNDGLGLSSRNNGFFMMFKQGTLEQRDFDFSVPVENRTEEVGVAGINETDVWLQQLNSLKTVVNKWERIPNTVGQTLQYNVQAKNTPLLYAVSNLGTGGIKLEFADGNFASVPVGDYRLYYRKSDNERFTMSPDDVGTTAIRIPYTNSKGIRYVLTVSLQLQNTVNNSLPEETVAGIKERAPQSYYAQDRMITNQDYQTLPLAKNTNIAKLKVTNRTHAGHSRYIDITDPTSTFQTTDVIAEDGALYLDNVFTSSNFVIDVNNTATEQINRTVQLILKNLKLNDFVYSTFRDSWLLRQPNKFNLENYNIVWHTLPRTTSSVTGYMTETFTQNGTIADLNIADPNLQLIQPGHMIKFVNPQNRSEYIWAKIKVILDNGRRGGNLTTITGPITLSEAIPENWEGVELITTLRKTFFDSERTAIVNALETKKTFGLGYNPSSNYFYVIQNSNLNAGTDFDIGNGEDTSGNGRDKSWLLKFQYESIDTLSYRYNVTTRGTEYVFESFEDVRFYDVSSNRIVDSGTGLAKYDTIELTTLNNKPILEENFEWIDSSATPDYVGDKWYSVELGRTFDNIPLRSRDTGFSDVEVKLQSNFGLFRDGDRTSNAFVNDVVIELGTTFDTSDVSNTNVVIANNSGVISQLPGNINIDFSNTTFGYNILSTTGNGNVAFKYNAVSYDTGNVGYGQHVTLANANVSTQTGNLVIANYNNKKHYAIDRTGLSSKDRITVTYLNEKTRLEKPIKWSAVGNFVSSDGYTDPRKVLVTPQNSTGDDSPDNPIQFKDFVNKKNIILYEDFESFDGYTYSKPVKAGILDLRREDGVNFDGTTFSKIAGNSTGDASTNTGTVYEVADYDYFLVKNENIINTFDNTNGKLHNKKVYAQDTNKVYLMTYSSTNLNIVKHYESSRHRAKEGRSFTQNTQASAQDGVIFKWQHVADNSMRIDPSISNVHEFFILTETYYDKIQSYLNVPGTTFPIAPSSSELEAEFENLQEYKSASDQLLFKSGKFKLLFGNDAQQSLQARFKVVRLPGTSISDNEIKTKVIAAVNRYFEIDNWDFGDTFYFTELSSYIHQQVGNTIGSIVIVPKNSQGVFGDLFQVKCSSDELFLSTATVLDVDVVDKLTSDNLRPAPATQSNFSTYENSTEEIGPYAIDGYYPLYSTAEAANFVGDGTNETFKFFGKTFYMPKGITQYKGNYVTNQATTTTYTGTTATNDSIGSSAQSTASGSTSNNQGGGSGGSGGGGSGY